MLESDVTLFVRRIEIPVIGRDGELSGVPCRDSPLISASCSTPVTQDQHRVTGEPPKCFCILLATISEGETEVEGN